MKQEAAKEKEKERGRTSSWEARESRKLNDSTRNHLQCLLMTVIDLE
jgi:hypothetical protein